jgi:GT2 family glycosyltransferase
MDVSVIILNYNTFALTSDCIQSVIHYSQGFEYEIVLLDNASTECDPSLFLARFPSVTLIKSETNLGFAKGNNHAIDHGRGEFVLLLNSDTVLQDNAILKCLDYLRKHPKTGVVTTKLVFPDGRIQSNCQRFPNIWYNLLELFRFQKLFPRLGGRLLLGSFFDYSSEEKIDWTWGAFFMFPKHLLDKLPSQKLYDGFFMYGEDLWWCWDVKQLGYDVVFLPDSEVSHLMGGSSGPKFEEMAKNRLLFMKRNYNWFKITVIKVVEYLLRKSQISK